MVGFAVVAMLSGSYDRRGRQTEGQLLAGPEEWLEATAEEEHEEE